MDRSYERGQVVQIINSVIDKVHESDMDALRTQLGELKVIIEDARQAMSTARTSDINDKHIPTASDELDEVVKATEQATGTIMDSCDVVQSLFDAMDGPTAEAVENEITRIYEACSFQDITGQRISKVISALRDIEEKVTVLMSIVGGDIPVTPAQVVEEVEDKPLTDEDLLNGPQMPHQAMSQEEIDRLLLEFD